MPAILVTMGTKYACNLSLDGDQICLQSWFKRGPDMPAMSVTLGTIYACNRICWGPYMPAISNIRSPFEPRLQAYMVLILTEIADIFGSQRNCYCRRIRSPRYAFKELFCINLYLSIYIIWISICVRSSDTNSAK